MIDDYIAANEKYIEYIKPNEEEYNKTEKERGVTNEQLKELGIADSADGLTRREAQEILVLANTRGNRRSSRTLSSNLDNESNDIANDTVRSEGLPAGSPDGGEDARLVGKGSGQDSRGADGGRDTRSVGEPRRSVLDGSRPGEQLSESPKKNVNNNHVERGKDYAPNGVDARIEANIAMHKEKHHRIQTLMPQKEVGLSTMVPFLATKLRI